MRLLEGKSALITGAAGGIGRAAALTFVREGARVAVSDLTAGGVEETAELVREIGGEAEVIVADVTKEHDVMRMVEKVVATFGKLDCAFNNAGMNGAQVGVYGRKTADWTEEAFDRLFAVNVKGVFLCMKHEILQMQKQGGGAIVNAGSIAGLVGRPTSAGYVASKHGVVGLTKTAALEYAESGIRINAVCPGVILTPMTAERMQRNPEATIAQIPLRRVGQPEEIANMVAWCCSDRASYVTGAAYNVDGGYMAI